MVRRVLLVVTCLCLGTLCAGAQELAGGSDTLRTSGLTLAGVTFPAVTTAVAGNNAGAVDAVTALRSTSLMPTALPPLDTGEGVEADNPVHPFRQPGLTIGWQSKPVDRGQDGFQWDGYLKSNVHMLTWQHAWRVMFQEKTRAGLRQPIFPQWGADIKAIPRSWGDGDGFVTNYVGHPYMGSIMGFLQVMHSPVDSRIEIGDAEYWKTRSVTLAATAAASLQFEIGPLSEASLGLNPTKQGLVDFVMTPLMGTGFLVAEDAIDKYIIAKLETGKGTKTKRFLRCAMNPGRMAANLFAFRAPWSRDTRPE